MQVNDDYCCSAIFHIYVKIGNKKCNVIIDSGSGLNIVLSIILAKASLKVKPHPNSYKASWVNNAQYMLRNLVVFHSNLVPITI